MSGKHGQRTPMETRLLIIGGWILALGGLIFVTPCAVAVIAFQAGRYADARAPGHQNDITKGGTR